MLPKTSDSWAIFAVAVIALLALFFLVGPPFQVNAENLRLTAHDVQMQADRIGLSFGTNQAAIPLRATSP